MSTVLHFFLNTWGSIKTLRRGENTQGVVQGPSALAGSPWYSEQWKKLYLGGRGWVWKLPRPVAGLWRSASWPYLTPRGEKLVSCEQKLLISDQWVELSHLNWYIYYLGRANKFGQLFSYFGSATRLSGGWRSRYRSQPTVCFPPGQEGLRNTIYLRAVLTIVENLPVFWPGRWVRSDRMTR